MTITDQAAKHAQTMEALALANSIRLGQSALTKELKRCDRLAGLRLVADWLDAEVDQMPDVIARHRVVGLLDKITQITEQSAIALLKVLEIPDHAILEKRVNDLSDRQRMRLVQHLRWFAGKYRRYRA